jgi:prolyl-tRNA editing enzyme YbaK/EbsC (Cys-tRNA(Pro) deacylase)
MLRKSRGSVWRWRLSYGSRSNVQRVREALEERGLTPRVVVLEQTARSAAEAAQALGCRVEQIVKSLVFQGGRTGRFVLVLASGVNRVDERKISVLLSESVRRADAAYVREKTGFSIGGVPPVGHAEDPATFVDEDLMGESVVWAAAGHTHAVFGLTPAELLKITNGRVVAVK